MKPLWPVEKLYHFLVTTKNFLYDRNFIRPVLIKFPVVSVGNISFGGSGKTPFIIFLAEELALDSKVNIVTRSYKSSLREPRTVNLLEDNAAAIYGDEACLIQKKLPGCSVWSGPNKASTAAACTINQPDVILVDDGFSHRKLQRNFDLVLIDASAGRDEYLREPSRNLKRAHAVVITKTNLVEASTVSHLEKMILGLAPNLANHIFTSEISTQLAAEKSAPLFVFCGLGKPQTFVLDLQQQGYKVIHQDFFPDHFRYSLTDQQKILDLYFEMKISQPDLRLVTTEKDYVKISLPRLQQNLTVTEHRITMAGDQKEVLLEKIRQAL